MFCALIPNPDACKTNKGGEHFFNTTFTVT